MAVHDDGHWVNHLSFAIKNRHVSAAIISIASAEWKGALH
jgi:hypothetical protein